MATDPISGYQEAHTRYDRATRAVENMVALITATSDALRQNWKRVSVSNVGVGFPAEVNLIRGNPSVNGSDWPDATRLAKTLAEWHTARHELDNAYGRIPESQRSVIQPPPPK